MSSRENNECRKVTAFLLPLLRKGAKYTNSTPYVIDRKQRVQEGNSTPSPIAEEGYKVHQQHSICHLSIT